MRCAGWRIDDYFRILKSGCRIEDLQHQTTEHLQRAIAIRMVIAWRIQLMTRLGREVPELPAKLLFSDTELHIPAACTSENRYPPPTNLGQAVFTVARLGGWFPNPSRGPPGTEIV